MRIPPIYIILGVFFLVVAVVTVDSLLDRGSDGTDDPDVVESQIDVAIEVNNPDWGRITVLQYDGENILFQAIPNDGYCFVSWVDREGNRYDVSGDTISYELIKGKYVTAVFAEGNSSVSSMSFNWMMPVYGGSSVSYTERTFSITISADQYREATALKVNRTAIAGNVYLTPWNLCMDDYAVQEIVAYLEPLTDGMTDLMKANTILKFVQDVTTYRTDTFLYGTNEYWATPLETIYNKAGDCEDTSVLFCSVSARMGLDVGLVGFTYSDSARQGYGHMGAAVALTQGASAEGATTFFYDGRVYVYCETTNSDDLGVLRYDSSKGVYLINDGTFTRIGYSDGAFNHDPTVSIASNYEMSSDINGVYGSSFEEPPAVPMAVGDSFSYRPVTSLPSVITATGDGLVSEGGFLVFSDGILTGTAPAEGTYTVTLKAYWESDGLSQTTYQKVTLVVGESDGGDVENKVLEYNGGQWLLSSESTSGDEDGGDTGLLRVIIIGMAVVCMVVIAVRVMA